MIAASWSLILILSFQVLLQTYGWSRSSHSKYALLATTDPALRKYGYSARVVRPSTAESTATAAITSVTPVSPSTSQSTATSAVVTIPQTSAPGLTAGLTEKFEEEARKEDLRVSQLESLLGAFRSAVSEKEQLISLEEGIRSQMMDVRDKGIVTDTAILAELQLATDEKTSQISVEKGIVQEIIQCADQLDKELSASRKKMGDLSQPSSENQLQEIMDWCRSRDERVLLLINKFDEVTRNENSMSLSEPVPEKLADLMDTVSNKQFDAASTSTGLSIAGATIAEISAQLRMKSNSEIAAVAGATLGKTGGSLVEVTSCVITATAGFVFSPSSKASGQAIGSAAVSFANGAKALRQAWIAATQAFSSIDTSKEVSDTDNALTVDRIVAGVKNIVKSAEVKTALGLLGTNLQKSAGDAAKAADIAADQLSTSLNNSEKFRNAVKRLGESFVTLLAILGAASTRMAQEVKQELLGLPNEAKK